MNGFEETASLDPNTSQEFNNVLPYPESPTEETITVKMDVSQVDTHKFTLNGELKILIIIITDDEEIAYGRITSAPLKPNNSSRIDMKS